MAIRDRVCRAHDLADHTDDLLVQKEEDCEPGGKYTQLQERCLHSIPDSADLQFELSVAHYERLFDHEQGLRLMQQVHPDDVRFVSWHPVRSTASAADNHLA